MSSRGVVLRRSLALVTADVRAGRRSLGSGPVAIGLSAIASSLLGLVTVVLAVLVATVVSEWSAAPATAAAAGGAVDLAFATLLAAGLLAPLLGAGAARIRSLASSSGAPVDGASLVLAIALRESLTAPLAPVFAVAVGAALGASSGLADAVHAVVVVLTLAAFALAVGTWLDGWLDRRAVARRRRSAWPRLLVATIAMTAVAATAGHGAVATDGGVVAWLSGTHASRAGAALAPGGWAATAVAADAGMAAIWAPFGLAALAAWAAAGAARHPPACGSGATGAGQATGSGLWSALRGPFGALLAKDLILLRRDPAFRIAAIRHAAPALLPFLVVAWAAWSARGDAASAARVAGVVPRIGLLAHLVTVALTGAVATVAVLDRGGRQQLQATPVRARAALLSKAVTWMAVAAPVVALAVALCTVATALTVGLPLAAALAAAGGAALEASSSLAAGAGAGLLFAALRPAAHSSEPRAPSTAAESAGGVLAGLGGGLLTVAAVAPVAAVFHGLGGHGPLGVWSNVVGTLVGPAIGLLATLTAAQVVQARTFVGDGARARTV